jgi:glycosyltransferase involved in cell wall biosynthesis
MSTQNTPSDLRSGPLISVIVPCYNSEATIRQCLDSIIHQRTSIPFDVIVVDSSTDRTPEIIQKEFPRVRLIHMDKQTFPGAARNIGAKSTGAQFCWMIDSDCISAPNALELMTARLQEDKYSAVAGSLLNGTPGSLSGWLSYLIEFKEFMPTLPLRLDWKVATANIAYPSDVLKLYGYYDEDMRMSEDILFHWKMASGGEQILFDPAIEATHLNRTGWRRVLLYQVDLGRYAAVARKRGSMPGQFLLRHPTLILLMPFVRTWNAMKWFAAHDLKTLGVLLVLSPMYLVAASFWTYGFFRQAIKEK